MPKLSQEEIHKLKSQHPSGVFRVTAGASEYYFRKLNRAELSASISVAASNPLKASEIQVQNTLLFATSEDKKALQDDMGILMKVIKDVNEINKMAEGVLEEL
jgi:hypothetical protein